MSDVDHDPVFMLPTAPAGPWDQLTVNEQTWIEFIRVISGGRDPRMIAENCCWDVWIRRVFFQARSLNLSEASHLHQERNVAHK